ncbi:hypothetical protein CFOL_v3_05308 [Cephalotus follicularis]|uniref:DUF8040 domain-containing protein n=1 Tax=Cephalotus follicularis TaxID=3775 RepID=A0A1Q3B1X5_CEPFO|nr:hypothetical protein CFOL_v3_05308 [Cephalotus follicularis]
MLNQYNKNEYIKYSNPINYHTSGMYKYPNRSIQYNTIMHNIIQMQYDSLGHYSGHPFRCFTMFRMDKSVLLNLVSELEANYGLKPSKRMSALEMVCIFVFIVGQGSSNSQLGKGFNTLERL